MIRQEFHVETYWKVIVFYDVDFDLLDSIASELWNAGFSLEDIEEIFWELKTNARAMTCSNLIYHISIVLFNKHTSKRDYIDSIVHEAEHVKQAMLKAYKVEDSGEPPAYTIGFVVSRMYSVFKGLLC